jgi:hypothetical protein
VGLVVHGWPEDLSACVGGLVAHAPASVGVDIAVVSDDPDLCAAIGQAMNDFEKVSTHELGSETGWGKAQSFLLALSDARYAVVMDISTIFEGDAISPLVKLAESEEAVGAGWRGVNVALDKQWYEFEDAPAGEVDALLGYLMVLERKAALATPPAPQAQFYRNADMEWSLALRAAGGRLVSYSGSLPVRQERHRGYYDTDPTYRDEQSKINYLRMLKKYKGREDILAPRS